MSRNLRHRPTTPPPSKKTPQKQAVSDASTDDDYGGVDLISDSEEDEPDVEVAEEQAIIDSEEDDNDAALQPDNDENASDWAGFDVAEHPFAGGDVSQDFFDEQMARTTVPNAFAEASIWDPASSRRVRFDLSDSDSSSDTEQDLFPDIFLDQNSLDPDFRRTIENDNDNDDPPSDTGSYWDFQGDDTNILEGADFPEEDDDESGSSVGSSSGYESDEGETTEEDLPAEANYVPARSVCRRQSTDSSASEEEIPVIRRNPYRTPVRNGPRLGSWVNDGSKPFAVMDSCGKKLMMFKAKIDRRFSYDGTPTRPPLNMADEHDNPLEVEPMIRQARDLMMSAMFTPLDNVLGGQALGPPEAFYPFVSVAVNGTITQDSPSSTCDEDDIDDDDMWNIQDLIDFGDDSSDDEGAAEEEEVDSSSSPVDISSTPVRPTTANSEDQVHPLLSHLDRGLVGAFRQNQSRHQLLSRNAATRESLAFSGPYRQGTIRGIKMGRLPAANTPITPLRKIKTVRADVTFSPSPMESSVVAGEKRKFSGEQHGHKRSRSMV